MTKIDWNKKILSLTPEQFEELCYDLIESMLFTNLEKMKGGRDKGRDITADLIREEPNGLTTTTEKWFFQCKRYSRGIPFEKISSSIEWAITDRANYFVIMSNSYITPDCREQIEKRTKPHNLKFINWTDKKFQQLLLRYLHLLESYFPEEKIPKAQEKMKPHKVFEIGISIPNKFKNEFLNLMRLEKEERDEKILEFIRENILNSPDIDSNIKALIYQLLSSISYHKQDIEAALLDLDKALKITPKNRIVLINKGLLLAKIKKYNEAMKCYDMILEINENDKIAWNNKGHCLDKQNKREGAMICFKKAVEIDSNFIIARDNIGVLLKKQHKYREAEEVYDKTLRLFPNSKTTLNKKVDLLIEMKDFAEAYEIINKALEIDPHFIEALNYKGVVLERNGHYQKAEKYNKLALKIFKKVINLDPKFVLGHTNIVACLNNLRKFEEALKYIDKTLKEFPENAIAWSKKGKTLLNLKKLDEALDCIRKSLKIDPILRESLINEGVIYLEKGQYKKALKIANKILKIYDKDEDGWRMKGDAFREMGKRDRAKKYYEKMEKYKIHPKSLIESIKTKFENTIFTGNKPVRNYVLAAISLFNDEHKKISIKARGKAISKAVDVAEIVKNTFLEGIEVENIVIGSEELPKKEGGTTNISTIEIILGKRDTKKCLNFDKNFSNQEIL